VKTILKSGQPKRTQGHKHLVEKIQKLTEVDHQLTLGMMFDEIILAGI
jgi:hypothetical protein